MGLHQDEKIVAATMRKQGLKRSRKFLVLGGIAATFLIPAGAWAFMQVTGTGNAEAKAYQVKNLTVSNAGFTQDLFPGASADFAFTVSNTNPFPVEVNAIAATSADTFNGGGCPDGANLSGFATQLNANTPLNADKKVIPANGSGTVTVHNAVSLSSAATGPCGFKLGIKITGTQQAPTAAAATTNAG